MVSVLYLGIAFVFGNLWFFAPIGPITIIFFFVWLIIGQTFLNSYSLLIHRLRTPVTPRSETDAQTDQLPLSKHYKKTFSKDAKVHFIGVWFVTTSKTSVQAFPS